MCVENLDAVFFIEMATLWPLLQLYSSQTLTTISPWILSVVSFVGIPPLHYNNSVVWSSSVDFGVTGLFQDSSQLPAKLCP